MSFHFCTITTKSHIGKTFALCSSIMSLNNNSVLNVLLVDGEKDSIAIPLSLNDKIIFFDTTDLRDCNLFLEAKKRYSNFPDKIRWTLKPVFLSWLLAFKNINSKIIYVDNDIFFTGKFEFLFEMLDEKFILLTPHWRADDPFNYPWWFETNFRDGVYNAGFIGANSKAQNALEWWAKACLYECRKSYLNGFFDDQKYLDLMPVVEPNTAILNHKGCNIAYWNIINSKRSLKNGNLLLNETYPPIFIHFADCTIAAVMSGEDSELFFYLNKYVNTLKEFNFDIDVNKILRKELFWGRYRHFKWLITGGAFILISSHYSRLKKFYRANEKN